MANDLDDYDRLIDMAEDAAPTDEPAVLLAPNLLTLRRTLRQFIDAQTAIADELGRLTSSTGITISAGTAAVLAAMALGQRYPVDDDEDPKFRAEFVKAFRGPNRKPEYVREAAEEITAIQEIAQRALVGLHLLDRLGLPLPITWSNLPAARLARAINAHCFAIFGGNVIR